MNWNIFKYLVRFGEFLPRQRVTSYLELSLLRSVLEKFAINCVIDVGANRGQFAQNLRRIGYHGFICSFEPIPEEFEILSATFQHDRKWRGFNVALGSEESNQIFHVTIESSRMSSLLQPKYPDLSANMREIVVEVRRLDSLYADVVAHISDPRVFLKIDTQGYDLEVVKGTEKSIEQILCIQSELSAEPVYYEMPHYLESLDYYEQLGFHLAGLSEVARNRSKETVVELNCLMARPEHAM